MNSSLKQDLDKKFSSYKLVKLDGKEAREQSKLGQVIVLEDSESGQELFTILIERSHIRVDDLKLEVTGEEGTEDLEREEGVTYKGSLFGNPTSIVRLMNDEKSIEGFITNEPETYFISSARKYSKSAENDDVVVYTSDSVKSEPAVMNEPLRIEDIQQVKEEIVPALSGVNQLRVIKLATEADYDFVTKLGGVAQANNYIMSVVNMIEGLYERELGLTFEVTAQHAWTTQDPYTPNNGGDLSPLLMSMMSYWNQNRPVSSHPRDVAHLFTGRWQGAGLAFIGAICKMPQYSYGVSSFCGDVSTQHLVTAHELGHNLGAEHNDEGECVNSVMNAMLTGAVTSFCQSSRNAITNYVAQFGSCLSTQEDAPKPQPIPEPSKQCTYEVSGNPLNFGSNGGGGSIEVKTDSNCYWTPVSNASWILLDGRLTAGSGILALSVQPNPSKGSRTGTISVEGITMTITQVGIAKTRQRINFFGWLKGLFS